MSLCHSVSHANVSLTVDKNLVGFARRGSRGRQAQTRRGCRTIFADSDWVTPLASRDDFYLSSSFARVGIANDVAILLRYRLDLDSDSRRQGTEIEIIARSERGPPVAFGEYRSASASGLSLASAQTSTYETDEILILP